jgi:pimeloyl-ACP methyl ester carboxylesterase
VEFCEDAPVFATSGSAQLAYTSTGTGDAVLLIHAGVTDRRGWQHLTERLAPSHRVIAYDQRGFGDTTYTPEPYSRVADAIAVLDAAGADRVAVVGCSMGGGVAIDLALEHPERVSRLVLIGAWPNGATWPHSYPEPIEGLVRKLDAAEEAGDVDEVNRLEAWLWLDGPTAPEGRVGGPARELFLDMNGQALRAEDPGETLASEPPAWDRLDRIAVPTLSMVGELDLPDHVTIAGETADRIPGARFVRLPDVAHVPHLEGDDLTLTTITSFV